MNAGQLARYDTRVLRNETSKQMADGDGECMCFFFCCDIIKGRIHGDFVVCVAMRCENVENVEKIDEGRL